MRQMIVDRLMEIQDKQQIRILFACESGSRGWEFPSPDSDYDARFVYIRSLNDYLSVQDLKYHLSFPINGDLDIYGWDLRKVLQLIGKSNTTPFEWLQSPIVYHEEDDFKWQLWSLCQYFFDRRSNIHHYLGIARGAMENFNYDEIGIKKLFYILRPLLAAAWCLERKSIAPMTIGSLMEMLPSQWHTQVDELILLKSVKAESCPIRISDGFRKYMDDEFVRLVNASKNLRKAHFDTHRLDHFFITTIRQYDNK